MYWILTISVPTGLKSRASRQDNGYIDTVREMRNHGMVGKNDSALDYIEANLADDIDIEQAARLACCSSFHFRRMFYAFAGSRQQNTYDVED